MKHMRAGVRPRIARRKKPHKPNLKFDRVQPGCYTLAVLLLSLIPDKTWRVWAHWCALQVIGLWRAPEIVRRYLETGDDNQGRCRERSQ